MTVSGTGSRWENSGDLYAGFGGEGTVDITNGGVVSNTVGRIGANSTGSVGWVTVSGAGSEWINSDSLYVGYSGNGMLTIHDGGRVSATSLTIASGVSGVVNIGGAVGEAAAGVGTLDAPTVTFGAGNGTLNFNHLNTSGGYVFAAAMSGAGTINHLAGVTALSGASGGFSGATDVSGGTLLVNGTLGGTVAVDDGAFLGGTGTLGAVSIADGGTLLGQQGETLTMGSLALSDEFNVNVALGAEDEDALALFNVTGNLTLDGILNVQDLGGFGIGTYQIFSYGGVLTNNVMDIGMTPAGVLASALSIQTAIAGEVNLVNSTVASIFNVWMGGDGVWNTADSNWTDADATVYGAWSNGQFATFQGAAGTVTVAAGSGIAVDGMHFAVDGYTITGDEIALLNSETIIRVGTGAPSSATMTATIASNLTGAGGLVKQDYGTLILSGTNAYAGGTFVRGGVLQVASDTNLGAATGGLVLEDATLRTTADMSSARAVELAGTQGFIETLGGTSLTLSGTVSGAGSLVKEGAGTLVLSGTNSYTGNTFVQAGTLVGNIASIRGDLTNNGVTVFDQASNGTFAGKVEGSGQVIKQGAGQLTLAGVSSSQWQVDAGRLTSAAERFTGDVAIGAAGTMNFNQIANADYGGTLSGSGTLLKTGSGLLTAVC